MLLTTNAILAPIIENGKIHQIKSYEKSFFKLRSGISSLDIITASKKANPVKKPYQLTSKNSISQITKSNTTKAKMPRLNINFLVLILKPKKLKYSFTFSPYKQNWATAPTNYVNYIINKTLSQT